MLQVNNLRHVNSRSSPIVQMCRVVDTQSRPRQLLRKALRFPSNELSRFASKNERSFTSTSPKEMLHSRPSRLKAYRKTMEPKNTKSANTKLVNNSSLSQPQASRHGYLLAFPPTTWDLSQTKVREALGRDSAGFQPNIPGLCQDASGAPVGVCFH